jgi:glycosyltransferase involved in cell wall biosynthesis
MKYYVITPAKNEENYISLTLESMVQQTLKPVKWIIVDDGSTDKTREIVEEYCKIHSWIEVMSIENKEEKKLYGSKVVKAFNVGYNTIKNNESDFVVKLDADLSFAPNYFEEVALAFKANSKLGICAGYVVMNESELAQKKAQQTYLVGAIKSVQTNCFHQIGGFLEANGWDGLDQLSALYLGWQVQHIPLTVIHHRFPTSEYLSLQFFYNNGVAHYRSGNDFFLTLVRSVVQLRQKPYILGSLNYFKGYWYAKKTKQPMLVDDGLAKFIRSYHYKRLLKFKR